MIRYLLKRFTTILFALFFVASITFFLTRIVPGDPFLEEQSHDTTARDLLRKQNGLDLPLWQQYALYWKELLQMNLGYSLKYPAQKVTNIISDGFPKSLLLGLEALAISLPLGMILGTLFALYSRSSNSFIFCFFSILGISLPSFVLASSLQYIFALKLSLFPVARWGTFSHTILPACALAIGPTFVITRLLHSSILEVLQEPFVMCSKMKGLSTKRILVVHVWKNAILPLVGYLGPLTTNILLGSFAIERVFGIPGLGQWFVCGIMNRDYPVIGTLTLFYSAFLLMNHFFFDLLSFFLNPRLTLREIGECTP